MNTPARMSIMEGIESFDPEQNGSINCFVTGFGTGGSYNVLAVACDANMVNCVFVSFI